MTTPPPAPGAPVAKNRGLGCLGCGCLILVLLVLLFVGLIGGACYWTYHKAAKLTSATPSTVQTFDGGDALYQGATQKLTAFDQALQQHQPATLRLSADEINTQIARDRDFADNNIHVFLTMIDDKADMQISFPTNALQVNLFSGRYVNGEISFGMNFDPTSKTLNFVLHGLHLANQEVPKNILPTLQNELAPAINQLLQKDPECQKILNQAKSIEIKDGVLIIEIQ